MKGKTAVVLVAVFTSLFSCSKPEYGNAVLIGEIDGDPGEVVVLSYRSGQLEEYLYPEVSCETGRFEQTIEDVNGFVDLVASVGGKEFGARINAGDTLRMHFTVSGNDCEVSYDGATEFESRIWTDFYYTYGYWGLYNIRPDPDPDMSEEEAIALLDRNDAAFRTGLSEKLSAKDSRYSYYIHRADLAHNLLKIILLENIAYRDGTDPHGNPEYGKLVNITDPNDPEAITFPLIYRWAIYDMESHATEQEEQSADEERNPTVEELGRFIAFMDRNDGIISSPASRRALASWMSSYCCSSIDLGVIDSYEPFITRLKKFYPEGTDIIEYCRSSLDAATRSLPGASVPNMEMLAPDGGKVALSSFYGKVLYIDLWATWCGPCLKEGPYFQKLAEQFKDDDRICFISISLDSTDDPWLAFLNKEKPFWPQFRLSEEADKAFCGKLGINTIPRFLLIGSDGKFISADAARPSDENTAMLLKNMLM